MIRTALDLLDALPKSWVYTFDDGAQVAHLGGEPDFFFAEAPWPSYDEERDRALRAYWLSYLERNEVPVSIRHALSAVRVSVDGGGAQG